MTNADIINKIAEARKLAFQEGIKSNTVLIRVYARNRAKHSGVELAIIRANIKKRHR